MVTALMQQVQSSQATANFGQLLVWLVVGLVFLWVVAETAKRVLGVLMPVVPLLIIAIIVGVLVIGVGHSYGF